MNNVMTDTPYQWNPPWWLRMLGLRFRDSRRSYRMAWGELGFRPGWALELALFDDPKHFSLHLHAFRVSLFIHLPFLQRWAYDPPEIMDAWGASCADGAIHWHWAHHTKITGLPWRDWTQTAHEVQRPDGSWTPYVGSYEERQTPDGPGKEPDGRALEAFPYRYLLRSGVVQERIATIYVERRTRKLRWLRRLPWGLTTYAISVEFSDEVGERSGSWKGGCVGCGYELREDETPRECLKRMERDRKF